MNTVDQSDITLSRDEIRSGIGKQLFTAFSVVALMTVLVSIIGWFSIEKLDNAQTSLASQEVPAITSALKLSEEIANLAASAPRLKAARNDEERKAILALLAQSNKRAQESLKTLKLHTKDVKGLEAIEAGLSKLPWYMTRLNQVGSRLFAKIKRRNELDGKLIIFRETVAKKLRPHLLNVRIAVIEESEDVLRSFQRQEELLEFKSATNLLVGLLAEGGKSNSEKEIEKIESRFLSSIAKMAVPLSRIEKTANVSELSHIFKSLLRFGSKGGPDDNILLLRKAELKALAETDEIMEETRDLSKKMSQQANEVVQNVEQSIQASIESNQSSIRSTKISLVLISVGALAVSALIGWFYVNKRIVHRLMVLVNSMENIAKGDLATRVNRNGSDEISLMGKALTVLRNAGRQAEDDRTAFEAQRQKSEEEKRQAQLSLADSLEDSSSVSMDKLSQNVLTLQEQARVMEGLSQTALDKSIDVTHAAERMTTDMGDVSASIGELSSSIDEISQQSQQGWKTADDAVRRADTMNDSISQLQGSSRRIGEVIMLINDVAAQTNMLALNATIEAARAGEAGKGFAVVAQEVKTLASQTENATGEIDLLIKGIQSEIHSTVEAAKHISHVIFKIKEVTTTIASAVEQQSAATSSIDHTVRKSVDECLQVSTWIKEVSEVSETTGQAIQEVRKTSGDVESESQGLQSDIARFLTSVRA
ncbi:methyl-accepting chemotaxis protein [Terasakiella sp. SH-1]|uniref:methyl-accepting chemotaxis protein n=1 Tax=Terasakiella sp. SH-1 TaxID=2560057 RepID=UPI001073160C|nr:methyl-accepting chemotaxis protein [Terasakiella sp. SH-1]